MRGEMNPDNEFYSHVNYSVTKIVGHPVFFKKSFTVT